MLMIGIILTLYVFINAKCGTAVAFPILQRVIWFLCAVYLLPLPGAVWSFNADWIGLSGFYLLIGFALHTIDPAAAPAGAVQPNGEHDRLP